LKKLRLKLILLTLVSYYGFIVAVPKSETDKGFNQNDGVRARINHVSENEARMNRIEYNSGMDPTPIPPFPPNFEIDTEFID